MRPYAEARNEAAEFLGVQARPSRGPRSRCERRLAPRPHRHCLPLWSQSLVGIAAPTRSSPALLPRIPPEAHKINCTTRVARSRSNGSPHQRNEAEELRCQLDDQPLSALIAIPAGVVLEHAVGQATVNGQTSALSHVVPPGGPRTPISVPSQRSALRPSVAHPLRPSEITRSLPARDRLALGRARPTWTRFRTPSDPGRPTTGLRPHHAPPPRGRRPGGRSRRRARTSHLGRPLQNHHRPYEPNRKHPYQHETRSQPARHCVLQIANLKTAAVEAYVGKRPILHAASRTRTRRSARPEPQGADPQPRRKVCDHPDR